MTDNTHTREWYEKQFDAALALADADMAPWMPITVHQFTRWDLVRAAEWANMMNNFPVSWEA